MSDLIHRATPNLLAEALALSRDNPESDRRWQLIHELHRRGTEDVFAVAKQLSEQSDASARELSADILSQLGELKYRELGQARPFTEQSVPILRGLLTDRNDRVVCAAIAAIGQHYRNAVVAEMPSLANHPSLRVRLSAAKTVRPQHEGLENPPAVEILIRLSEDEDEAVRNWATFGLGSQGDLDTPEIREALYRRLNDSDFDARSEALIALAERKDQRVVPFISAALASETVGALAVEAAGVIGSADFLPKLLELRSWWDVDTALLESAIRSCGGAEQ